MKSEARVISVMWTAVAIALCGLYMGQHRLPVSQSSSVHGQVRARLEDEPVREMQPRPPERWPTGATHAYRGGPSHTGRSAFLGPDQPARAWAFQTGGRVTAQAASTHDGGLLAVSHDGRLYCIDASGQLRWSRRLEAPASSRGPGGGRRSRRLYAAPLVDGEGHVYVGSDAGAFWSFDAKGKLRFRLDVEGEADVGATLGPDEQVLFAAGRWLYASSRDGALRWRYEAGAKIFTSPAVDARGQIYIGTQGDALHALAADGRLLWSFAAGGDIDSSPVIGDGGEILFGSDDAHVYALDHRGALIWKREVGARVRAPLALGSDGQVLVGVLGPRPGLRALDVRDGTERWRFNVSMSDSAQVGVRAGALVDRAGSIYFGAHDDHIYALTASGKLRWAIDVMGDVDAPAILSPDGLLVVGSDDGHLHAIRPGS